MTRNAGAPPDAPATASFAASMNSSIMRCAMLRSARVTPVIWPDMSSSMFVSGISKSIEPRLVRLRFRISASSRISSKRADQNLR